MESEIKEEPISLPLVVKKEFVPHNEVSMCKPSVIDLSSGGESDSDSSSSDSDVESSLRKKRKLESVLPIGFLDPLSPEERKMMIESKRREEEASSSLQNAVVASSLEKAVSSVQSSAIVKSCKQFWKAGDYEGDNGGDSSIQPGGMDHLRVHPRFLHSNATSHKWALGAVAELLDNALDEVCNGATYVRVDVLVNRKDNSKMLLVEDNGGGMTPDKMRQCMSLGYSVKSKMVNTIGQYGNGFKTSTMRLGADVIVFSRCQGTNGRSPMQSIGMLSYTFLRTTCKEDIVVPMIDYVRGGRDWNKLIRSTPSDWNRNLETILQWSPYRSEEELLQQFNVFKDQGTHIIIYNLWEDDEGQLELDFDTDKTDIQIRGVNRDEKKIEMANKYPNSKHFLTYRHSLRSYASILYLRIPPGFRIFLRGEDINHHNLVNDMMLTEEITYKPVAIESMPKDTNMVAVVTIGFVKDAKYHIDIQGFNVYHKNRLIKPFWRVWNAAGSDGRGVIGVLEANFVEPAHDKQGFERTTALSRLEQRLVVMQKKYWSSRCQEIGYAPRHKLQKSVSPDRESSHSDRDKSSPRTNANAHNFSNGKSKLKSTRTKDQKLPVEEASEDEMRSGIHERPVRRCQNKTVPIDAEVPQECIPKVGDIKGATSANSTERRIAKLEEENRLLRDRLEQMDGIMVEDLLRDLDVEREKTKLLETKLEELQKKMQEMDNEQESLIDVFSEERNRRDAEETTLRNRLKDASSTIQALLDKVKLLESRMTLTCKTER